MASHRPILKVQGSIHVGMTISGRYEIREHLGTGGFAKVFLAHDIAIERDVAMKFLDLRGMHAPESMIPVILERFRREAKLAARIPHRNVVNIFDIGQVQHDDGLIQPFIVMELLRGMDLEDALKAERALAPRRLLPLFVDCLDALGQAHKMGIVHKDLKPSNLYLSNPGGRSEALRIVDFGIAHLKNGGSDIEDPQGGPKTGDERGDRLTATGQILGTLQYLSPEYISHQLVTPALDVYQMGLILVEAISGHRMVNTDNAFECLRIHTFGLLEMPDYLLSSPLGPVLARALDANHATRYQDANEFVADLSQIDPDLIPVTPLILEGKVSTSQFGAGNSSPSLVHITSTRQAPITSEIEALGPANASAKGERRVNTRVAGQFGQQEQESVELVDVAPASTTKLFVLAAIFLLVIGLLATGVVMMLEDPPVTQATPTPSIVAIDPAPAELPSVPGLGQAEETPALPPGAVLKDGVAGRGQGDGALAPEEEEGSPGTLTPKKADEAQGLALEPPALVPVKTPPKEARWKRTLRAYPSYARVFVDGELCENPCVVSAPKKEGSKGVMIKAPGHITQAFRLSPEGGPKQVTLEREAPVAKPSEPTIKAPPVAKPPQAPPKTIEKSKEEEMEML